MLEPRNDYEPYYSGSLSSVASFVTQPPLQEARAKVDQDEPYAIMALANSYKF